MKNFYATLSFVSFLSILFFSACKDEVVKTFTYHTQVPYYLPVTKLRAMVVDVQAPQKLKIPGKIYLYGDYLFINELNKGIHVVDNSDPASPRFINFINIPGNADMAVNNHILYADNYIDLLAFDISNPAQIKAVKRVEDVFDNLYVDKNKGLILGYKDTVITYQKSEMPQPYYDSTNGYAMASGGGQSYGIGGSTAKFTLMNDHLFTIDNHSLKVFDVSAAQDPVYSKTVNIGFGIETIFPYQNKLFIGSTTGMHIYNASDPSAPVKLSTYQHFTSCDPVVVEGNYAYVTLRSANTCQQGVNLLEVLNIHDPASPQLVSSFSMLNPHGLAINASKLFICEGQNGLKAFDSSDVLKIGQNQLSFLKGFNAVDVIAGPKSLIVTGADGIYQFDYSDPAALRSLSHISLAPLL